MSILRVSAIKAKTGHKFGQSNTTVCELVKRLHANRIAPVRAFQRESFLTLIKSCSRFDDFALLTQQSNPFATTANAE